MQCAPEATEFGEITQNKGHYTVQVIQSHRFWYHSKLIYDFLLVINTNLPSVLHRFRDIVFDTFKIAIFVPLVHLTTSTEGFPISYHRNDKSLETRCFRIHFSCRKFRYVVNHFTQCAPEATEFGK